MKTILVTGGAGHVGSHIIEQLISQNPKDKIISLDNYSNGSKENHISGAEYREGHTKYIDTLIPETPDIVFHLGEYARISPSFDEPQKVYDQNIV
jgi:UDP-glucose 4-epimerase